MEGAADAGDAGERVPVRAAVTGLELLCLESIVMDASRRLNSWGTLVHMVTCVYMFRMHSHLCIHGYQHRYDCVGKSVCIFEYECILSC